MKHREKESICLASRNHEFLDLTFRPSLGFTVTGVFLPNWEGKKEECHVGILEHCNPVTLGLFFFGCIIRGLYYRALFLLAMYIGTSLVPRLTPTFLYYRSGSALEPYKVVSIGRVRPHRGTYM